MTNTVSANVRTVLTRVKGEPVFDLTKTVGGNDKSHRYDDSRPVTLHPPSLQTVTVQTGYFYRHKEGHMTDLLLP